MKPLISIVIPAYNVAEYVAECINSIKCQTFTNYEVIIIDDGSKDNTLNVINENINEKFKVISQKNLGAGVARNFGIKLCTGQYITFMDADDKLYNKFCLEKIANCIEKENCDVITYRMVRFYTKSNKYVLESNITDEDKVYHNVDDYLYATIKSSRLSVSPCDKIIKASFLQESGVLFDSMAMLEDIDWSLKLYEKISTIMVLNEPIYVYRKQRLNSTTYSYNEVKILACCDFLKKWVDYDGLKKDLYIHYIAYQYLILIAAINNKNSSKKILKDLKKYSFLLNYNENFKVKKAYSIYKIFGYAIMRVTLKFYMYIKDRSCFIIS